jgi:carbonic anhydrase
MRQLLEVATSADIPAEYREGPIGLLLEYHNLGRQHGEYTAAQLLIAMCMDHRKHLRIPDNFAYVIRTGGANLKFSGFKVSYAIGVGGVSTIALIGHTNCGMVNLTSQREKFIQGLMGRAGWQRQLAEDEFDESAPKFEIGDEIAFVLAEAERLRSEYPRIQVAPLLYRVEDNRLYLVPKPRMP